MPLPHELPDYRNDHKRVALTPIRSEGETLEMFSASNDLKKAFNVRLNSGENYPLRREMVYCFFDIPAVEAARIMCVSLSSLKKIRTWVKVERWPCSLIHIGEFEGLTRAQIIQERDVVISNLEREYQISCNHISGSRCSKVSVTGSQTLNQSHFSGPNESNMDKLINYNNGIKIALRITKEAREYAALYLCLVIPDAGRKQMVKRKHNSVELSAKDMETSNTATLGIDALDAKALNAKTQRLRNVASGEERVKEIMDSMQPRQVVKRKTRVSVLTTVEPVQSDDCSWPISITQEFNFDQLFLSDDMDDELKLGPVKLSSTVSTTVVVERGDSVNRADASYTTADSDACSGEEDFGLLGL